MKRLLVQSLVLLVVLAGCAAPTSEEVVETTSAPVTSSAEAEPTPTSNDPEIVQSWLKPKEVSAQQILEDLTFEGYCREWWPEPDAGSQYGQAYARDLTRGCDSGPAQRSAPDCSAWLEIWVEDEAAKLPVETYGYESAYLAVFSNPRFSVAIGASMSEYAYETLLQRCWSTIEGLSELLGESVEAQVFEDYSLDTDWSTEVLSFSFADAPDDYFEIGDGVYWRWYEDPNFTCYDNYYTCATGYVVTIGWCENLKIDWSFVRENNDVIEGRSVILSSETSYSPFSVDIGSDTEPDEDYYFLIENATCSSWLR